MTFTEALLKFTSSFEASNYDISSLTKIIESLEQGHHFVKQYQSDLVEFEKIKRNEKFHFYLKENKWGWLENHNFPITLEILNKEAVPGKQVSVRIMGGQRRTLVIYYAICPELENFVNIVNWVDSQSSKNAWIKIRELINNQHDEVLEFSKSCGIRLPNKIHPGFDRKAKLVKKEILQYLYDWKKTFFLFDDGYAVSSHNSPINFKKIFFSPEKETTFIDLRTTIGKFHGKTPDGFNILIPTLFGEAQFHEFILSDRDFPLSKLSSTKLYVLQVFHRSGKQNIEDHITKIEEAIPNDLLGMFHAVSCYLLYLGNQRLKILNKTTFQKLFSHLFNQVSNFLNNNGISTEKINELDWKNIQDGFTSQMTRWIDDLYYIPPLLRKTFDEYHNPALRDFIVKEFDLALANKKSICFEEIPFNEQGNRWFDHKSMGKFNRIYSLIHFLLEEKRFINGFTRFYMNNREREYTMLRKLLGA